MKLILTILLILLSCALSAQVVNIGSKSYTNSYKLIRQDTCITLQPTGYADYPVKPAADGAYTFTIRAMNNAAKGVFLYMWSPATGLWTNAFMPVKAVYQNIPIKVSMNTGTAYVRLYSADSVTVDNISYTKDADLSQDLQSVLSRVIALEKNLNTVQRIIDSLPPIYIQKDYGTQANPIKP